MMNNTDTFETGLPHMSSIWLDEDEETEKLYNLQSEKFLRDDSDQESIQVHMLNSDSVDNAIRTVPVTPQSGSVEQFSPQRPAPSPVSEPEQDTLSVSPRGPSRRSSIISRISRSSGSSDSSDSPQTGLRKKLLLRLKKKWGGNRLHPAQSVQQQKQQISAPFHFQHIFHANLGAGFDGPAAMDAAASASADITDLTVEDSDSDAGNLTEDSSDFYKEDSLDMGDSRRGSTNTLVLSKAFCTAEIKSSEFDRCKNRKGRNSGATYVSYEVEECMRRRSSAFYL